jgi:hypothetical protein
LTFFLSFSLHTTYPTLDELVISVLDTAKVPAIVKAFKNRVSVGVDTAVSSEEQLRRGKRSFDKPNIMISSNATTSGCTYEENEKAKCKKERTEVFTSSLFCLRLEIAEKY